MVARVVGPLAAVLLPLLGLGLVVTACTSETTSSSGDAGTSSGDAATGTDGGAGSDSGTSGEAGADAAGGDCTNEDIPAAPESCTVEGEYDVVNEVVCPNTCGFTPPGTGYRSTVTVAEGIAQFEGGSASSPIRFSCTLEGCTCTTKSGEIYVFGAAGFDGISKASTGDCRFLLYEKGVRR